MFFISEELKPYLKISLGFHLGLFLFFGVKVLIFPDLSDLQDGTIKVDMVALPNKEDNKKISQAKVETPKPDAKKPEPKKPEPKKPEPKVVAKKVPEKKKTQEPKLDETDAFQKLQELQAMKKLSEVSTEEPETPTQPVADASTEIKGNRLAVGDSISGVNRIQYDNYKKVLHDAVKNKWNLPSWIQDGNLFAEALVKISDTGYVTEKVLTTSSGNSMYDKYVIQAITDASPFPAPPEKYVNIVGVKGVVLRFP